MNFKFPLVISFIIVTVAILSSCTSAPKGVTPVSGFEVERYLGKWYEIARLDHNFERNLSNVTALYSLRDDGKISVVNRGYNTKQKSWKEIEGSAELLSDDGTGSLSVKFFGPFGGGYHILEIDDNYSLALVSGPSKGYLWILSRTPHISDQNKNALLQKAKNMGFNVDELIFVEHDQAQ